MIKNNNEIRSDVINNALNIGITSVDNLELFDCSRETKQFFLNHYTSFSGNILTQERYKPSEFWFNDAGFQFMWRDSEGIIKPECLSWNEVLTLVNEIIREQQN